VTKWATRLAALPKNPVAVSRGTVAALSTMLLLLVLYAVVRRIGHPFALEWMEGAMVDHVARIARGRTVYVPPSLEFVPFVYPPLYYVVSAAVAKVIGIGFTPLRLVSVVAMLANLGWVYAFVVREGKEKWAGLAAAGFFAGTYPLSGFWFDIGRVDSLFVCLVLAAAYVLRFGTRWNALLGGAVLVTLAFFTKQAALVMAVPFAIYLFRTDWRRGLTFSASTGALVLGFSVLIDSLHHGWFGYYTHRVVGGHPLAWDGWSQFIRGEVLQPCGLALAVSLFFWLFGLPEAKARARLYYALLLAGMLSMAFMGRIHTGGWINVLMPAHAGIAIVFGLGLRTCRPVGEGRLAARVALLGPILAALQLASLSFDPRPSIPTAADRAAGVALVERIRAIPGPVWTTHRGYLSTLAGKRSGAHMMAMLDVMRSSADFAGAKGRLEAEIRGALASRHFDLVLMDNHDFWFLPALERDYRRDGHLWFADPNVFWPRAGAHVRPEVGYVPRVP